MYYSKESSLSKWAGNDSEVQGRRACSLEHWGFPPENTTSSWCFTLTTLCNLLVNSWSDESTKGLGQLWGSPIAVEWPCHCLAGFCKHLSNVKPAAWTRTKRTCSLVERMLRSDLNLVLVNGQTGEMCGDRTHCSAISAMCSGCSFISCLLFITY